MFGSFGLFAMWCLTAWEFCLGLAESYEVINLSFPMVPGSCDFDQLLERYALSKVHQENVICLNWLIALDFP